MQMQRSSRKKLPLIIGGSVAVILIAAAVVYAVLQYVVPKPGENVHMQTTAEKADASKKRGIKAEAAGDSTAALKDYQDAYLAYKKAGNDQAAADMSYKVEVMQNAIKASEVATKKALESGENGAHPVSN